MYFFQKERGAFIINSEILGPRFSLWIIHAPLSEKYTFLLIRSDGPAAAHAPHTGVVYIDTACGNSCLFQPSMSWGFLLKKPTGYLWPLKICTWPASCSWLNLVVLLPVVWRAHPCFYTFRHGLTKFNATKGSFYAILWYQFLHLWFSWKSKGYAPIFEGDTVCTGVCTAVYSCVRLCTDCLRT